MGSKATRRWRGPGLLISAEGRGTLVADAPKPAAAAAPLQGGPMPWDSPAAPLQGGPMPWDSLAGRAAQAEALARAERLWPGPPRLDAVNLAAMAPSPDLLPHALFRRCLEHALRSGRALAYSPREGVPRLREQFAADLARQGVPVPAEDVLVTTGRHQALDLVVRALVDPGEPALVNETTYQGALRPARCGPRRSSRRRRGGAPRRREHSPAPASEATRALGGPGGIRRRRMSSASSRLCWLGPSGRARRWRAPRSRAGRCRAYQSSCSARPRR